MDTIFKIIIPIIVVTVAGIVALFGLNVETGPIEPPETNTTQPPETNTTEPPIINNTLPAILNYSAFNASLTEPQKTFFNKWLHPYVQGRIVDYEQDKINEMLKKFNITEIDGKNYWNVTLP